MDRSASRHAIAVRAMSMKVGVHTAASGRFDAAEAESLADQLRTKASGKAVP